MKKVMKKIKCIHCGEEMQVELVASYMQDGTNIGLDLNPHNENDFSDVIFCGKCTKTMSIFPVESEFDEDKNDLVKKKAEKFYQSATYNVLISKIFVSSLLVETDIKPQENSEFYEAFHRMEMKPVALIYELHGEYNKAIGNYRAAANAFVKSYWLGQEYIIKDYNETRKKAIEMLGEYTKRNPDVNMMLTYIDLLRQNENFEEAAELAEGFIAVVKGFEESDKKKQLVNHLACEIKLSNDRDSKPHLLKEV